MVLAGHHLIGGDWFSVEVEPGQAPYLFDENGESSWASASAELLASLAALQFNRIQSFEVDNQANEISFEEKFFDGMAPDVGKHAAVTPPFQS